MGILDRLKFKAGLFFARNLAEELEAGKFGPTAQRLYIATKGQKTLIGTLLTVLMLAVTEFSPPYATEFFRYSALVTSGLTALGLLDKARRSEPIFPIWFLESLSTATLWVSTIEAGVTWLITHGWFESVFGFLSTSPGAADTFTLYMTAVSTATFFLGRLAKASAALPKGRQFGVIEGQE